MLAGHRVAVVVPCYRVAPHVAGVVRAVPSRVAGAALTSFLTLSMWTPLVLYGTPRDMDFLRYSERTPRMAPLGVVLGQAGVARLPGT